jgi:glycosyltransferase involved in cell wall biosynthesis
VELSVVVCAHNEQRHLPAQLDALLEQAWDREWEIVVVDNASTDDTLEIALAYAAAHPRVRVVEALDRAGQSYAMNVGATQARSDRLAFCDADDVVASGWVAAIGRGLGLHDVVTGPHELDLLNPSWLADSRGRSIEQPIGTFYGIFPCIRGAGWGVHREVYLRLGGMSEEYRAGQDVDFSLRAWLAGVPVVGLPDAIVHYRYRSSPRALWRQGFAYGEYRPRIARALRDAARPRPPRLAGWKSWVLLVLTLPSTVSARGRARWVWLAANRWGQVVGSVRARALLL